MLKVADKDIQTFTMDHHGLVAALCNDLKIAEKIDELLKVDPQRKVSPGEAVKSMIINGLGFSNRRLYLTPQFFESKPVEHLLGANITAEDLTGYTLTHTLDDISRYGVSKLFGEVAFRIALENDLLGPLNHLDTTSFSVEGDYNVKEEEGVMKIVYGYSKDGRFDLKQFIMTLIVTGPSHIPLWMEPLSGNSSDKESLQETIKRVEAFKKQINLDDKSKWVADAALYTKKKLLKMNRYLWLTRVPETIKEAKTLLKKSSQEINWQKQPNGYQVAPFFSKYGGLKQRWLLVFSQQAYQREEKTLEKRLKKKEEELKKVLWHMGNEIFQCEADGRRALKKLEKSFLVILSKVRLFP